jgi:glycosyltransferase involved in cell wall biosynthesis
MPVSDSAAVSVLIPAKNEEPNIAKCISSVSWADEIVVLDSFSSDKTVQIARNMGVRVVQREFDDYSTHFNWGLDNIDFKHEWILILHSDERVSDGLAAEICALLEQRPEANGYYIARQNWFFGKWIRHAGLYPLWTLRLLRLGYGHYESRLNNEHILVDGPPGYLEKSVTHPIIHYDYKGIERYFDRHNMASSMEAVDVYQLLLQGNKDGGRLLSANLAIRGPQRRRFLKNVAYRYLPARPLIRFFWMYVLQLGFLDGRIGFRVCVLQSFYEYQVSLKLEELKEPGSPLHEKYKKYL